MLPRLWRNSHCCVGVGVCVNAGRGRWRQGGVSLEGSEACTEHLGMSLHQGGGRRISQTGSSPPGPGLAAPGLPSPWRRARMRGRRAGSHPCKLPARASSFSGSTPTTRLPHLPKLQHRRANPCASRTPLSISPQPASLHPDGSATQQVRWEPVPWARRGRAGCSGPCLLCGFSMCLIHPMSFFSFLSYSGGIGYIYYSISSAVSLLVKLSFAC